MLEELRDNLWLAGANRRFLFLGVLAGLILSLLVPLSVSANTGSGTLASELRSGCETDYPPFCMVDSQGEAYGFSVELFRAAAEAMGRTVTFRTGTWAELKGLLAGGEIAALPLVGRTPEREGLFDFTFPYLSLHGALVIREDTTGVRTLADLEGRPVAVMAGDNAEEYLRRQALHLDIHTTPTFVEALEGLSEGVYDGVLVQRLLALRLMQRAGLDNLRFAAHSVEDFRQDFCFAVREGDDALLAVLNEGLALVMANGTYRRLHAKWFASRELPSRQRIVIGGDENFPPYEYVDAYGRPAGYNVDLMHAVAEAAGLDIEIRLGPWAEIRDALEHGEVDAIQGMFYSVERDTVFDFTPSHTVVHCVSVVRKGSGRPPATVSELAGKRIVVQQGDIMHDFAVEQGLADYVVPVENGEAALRQLAAGKHDCALMARMPALYWINAHGWKNLVVGRQPFLSPGYCAAVPEHRKQLLAQLSEGLQLVEQSGEYQRIHDNWMGVYEAPRPSVRDILFYSALVAVPLLLVLLGTLLWLWTLHKEVARRTADLTAQQELMDFIIRHDPNAIAVYDNNLRYIYASERYLNDYGVRDTDIIGRHHYEVFPETPQRWREIHQHVLGGAIERSDDDWFERPDGSITYNRWECRPWRRANGEVGGIITYTEVTTARKLAEQALRESERKYRELVENANSIILRMDPNGVILFFNEFAQQLFGYSEEEVLGRSVMGAIIPETDSSGRDLRGLIRGILETPEEFVINENENICRDGRRIWVAWTNKAIRDAAGALVEILCIGNDITERRQAEEALRRSETMLNETGDMARVGGWEIDLETNYVYWTRTTKRIHEVPDDYVPQLEEAVAFYPAEHRNRISEAVRRAREDGVPYDLELAFVTAKGRRLWVRALGRPEFQGRKCVRLHGTFQDITERHQAEEENARLQEQLLQSQKLESVGRLAGGVAHDFNNMLNVILGNVELALDTIVPEAPLHAELVEIQHAAERSAALTGQLLAFARRQVVMPKRLDINDAVSGMLKMLQRLGGENITLDWHPGAETWPVFLDPAQFGQILTNLYVNARDAIDGVGNITIETRNATLDKAFTEVHPESAPGDYVMLAISDTGCGMDEAVLSNLFEPFFTTKPKGEGSGLGLSTVYGIVRQNDGFIDVRSEPGHGATFKVFLPRHEAVGDAAVPESPGPEAPVGEGETILLVEDEEAILTLGARMLRRLHYDVLAAETPGKALELAQAHSETIQLVLTDVIMPEMNGRELVERLRVLHPNLKALYMSGYTADVIAHRGILDEDVRFVQKPFSRVTLATAVRNALEAE